MIQTKIYPNGLRLVVETNPNASSSECLFYFDVGALNEREYETGYAHMLEHMLAGESSNKHSIKEINDAFTSAGVNISAFTYLDKTTYSFCSLNQHFEKCFEILCERIFDCAFDEKEFEKEKKVIFQEYSTNSGSYSKQLNSRLFDGKLPNVLGNSTSIKGANLDRLKDFYAREYTPGNLVISIYGNKTLGEIEALLDKNVFCYIDKNKFVTTQKQPLPKPSDKKQFVLVHNGDPQANVFIVFPQHNQTNPFACDLLVEALNGLGGLLLEKLRLEEGLVYNAYAWHFDDTNSMRISFACAKEDVPKCLAKVRGILEDIATNGLSPSVLRSAIAKNQLSIIMEKDSSDYKVETNAKYLLKNKVLCLEEELKKYNTVDNEQIKAIAKDLLQSNFLVMGYGRGLRREHLQAFDPSTSQQKPGNITTSKKPKILDHLLNTIRELRNPSSKKEQTSPNDFEK